jgi:hypothetical protein
MTSSSEIILKKQFDMKVSSVILLVTFFLPVTALFASNYLLKKEYDKIDKSDIYWTYDYILQQPFKHLVVDGGNLSKIAYEPSKKSSVRVFKMWKTTAMTGVTAVVRHDTLFLHFPEEIPDPNEKQYLRWNTMVRVFSPELLSVDGNNTNFGLYKLKQKNISINLSGKSKLEVESYLDNFDSIQVAARDSSEVVFEMSPDLIGTKAATQQSIPRSGQVTIHSETGNNILYPNEVNPTSWERMYIDNVDADIKGASLLDIGHAQVNTLHLTITDTSGVILSGGTLKRLKK